MTLTHPWRRIVLRSGLVLLVLVWPMTGISMPISPFALIIGACLVYDGVTRGSLAVMVLLLFTVELLYDLGPGLLTVSYMVCAVVIVALHRWLSIIPFVRESGWPLGALLRTALVGSFLLIVALVTMTAIASTIYGREIFVQRIVLQFIQPSILLQGTAAIALIVVVLARIDRPWRRPITYGI